MRPGSRRRCSTTTSPASRSSSRRRSRSPRRSSRRPPSPTRSSIRWRALTASVDAFLAWVQANEVAYMKLMQSAGSVPGVRALITEIRDRTSARILEGLGLADDPRSRAVVRGWLWLMDGVIHDWLEHRDLERAQVGQLLVASLGGALAGWRRRPERAVQSCGSSSMTGPISRSGVPTRRRKSASVFERGLSRRISPNDVRQPLRLGTLRGRVRKPFGVGQGLSRHRRADGTPRCSHRRAISCHSSWSGSGRSPEVAVFGEQFAMPARALHDVVALRQRGHPTRSSEARAGGSTSRPAVRQLVTGRLELIQSVDEQRRRVTER